MKFARNIARRLRAANGQTMTEYALILATVAAVCASLYNTSGNMLKELVDQIGSSL